MAEVGREVGQPRLGVDALPVPRDHPMDDEGVAQIVNPGPAPARFGLEAGGANDLAQVMLDSHVRVSALLVAEQRRVRIGRKTGLGSLGEVADECRHDGRLDRQATGLEELGLTDLERAVLEPKITKLQPHHLTHPEADAVREHEHGVERLGSKRSLGRREVACRPQQALDLLGRVDVRPATRSNHRALQEPVVRRRSGSLGVGALKLARKDPSDLEPFHLTRG